MTQQQTRAVQSGMPWGGGLCSRSPYANEASAIHNSYHVQGKRHTWWEDDNVASCHWEPVAIAEALPFPCRVQINIK